MKDAFSVIILYMVMIKGQCTDNGIERNTEAPLKSTF